MSKNSRFKAPNALKKEQARESEWTEVSYTVLDNIQKEDPNIVLQKIAAAINVQLTLADDEEEIPFVPFDEFNSAMHEDKVYLYGTSGSGKSRTMFEIIKSKVTDFERIFIINPRNIIMGSESGRIDIYELAHRLTEADAVLWDNFPDDLVKENTDSANKAIEIISSKNVKILLVALKPKYLEFYRDLVIDIPGLYQHQLNYDKDKFRSIVKLYGINTGFKQLFEKYLAKDLDKVAKILWEKEPTPLTVLDYYKELSNKESQRQYSKLKEEGVLLINVVVEAENLLRSTQYYEHQFDYISSTEKRHSHAEFLYTLRLCYETGLDRTIDTVEKLQKDIFNSMPPRHASRHLSTWVYLSGQYYAMHDVARQSIKFDDYVKTMIMRYLTNNFLQIVPKEKNQVYSFAVFFGKNFQYITRDESCVFLPAHVYEYMKSNRYFENCMGYGIGESFPSMDDELQQAVLNRLGVDTEFAEGFGYSLGLSFSSLDDTHRQEIFKRIYSGMPFAWLFGESLGRVFRYLSEDVKRETFEQIKRNTLFATGIGRGLGYSYTSLDASLQQEIFERAKTNSELTHGLGLGLGKNFSSLSEEVKMEILGRAEKDPLFDQGLGNGFGEIFEQSTREFRRWVFERGEKSAQFTFGEGGGIGNSFLYLDEECQKAILERVEKDGEFADGFGSALAYSFSYLSVGLQKEMFELAERNKRFAYGLGLGFGLVFNFLPKEFKYNILAIADKNIEFDQGLGFGIGLTFAYLVQDIQEEIFERAEKDGEFAYGLGYTLGYTSTYLTTDLQAKILTQSEKNKDLRTGLGSGAGLSFAYQTEDKQLEIFEKMIHDGEFAKGLGMALGRFFKYFTATIQNRIFEKVEENPLFSYGLGYGIGYVFTYNAKDLQKEIFERINNNPELALGLGHGLGHTLMYLGKDVQKEIFERAEYEPEFAYGLGYSLGRSFKYLRKEIKNEITARSATNVQLAIGFGGGIGSTILFKYIAKEQQEEIFQNAIVARDSGFSRGIGTGIGRTFKYLDLQQQEEVLRRADENSEFAIGLGLGLGFVYQSNELPEKLSKKVDENMSLARGYGEGLGHFFKYLHQQEKKTLERMTEDIRFSKGLGTGIGRTFKYLDRRQQQEVLRKADENSHFAFGLSLGLGSTFKYLDRRQQQEVLRKADENSHFGKGFTSGVAYIFKYLSKDSQTEIFEKTLNQQSSRSSSSILTRDFGLGLGHNFPSLKEELQEETLMLAEKNKEFADGLGQGLACSFKYLSEISQDEILRWAASSEQDGEFAKTFGLGLGHNFPSLKEELQERLLKLAEQDHHQLAIMFASGLAYGLAYSFKYLNKELQGRILILAGRNQYFSKAFQEDDITKMMPPQIYNDYPIIGSPILEESASYLSVNNVLTKEEVSFSGRREKYCVCYIDMMNSTKIVADLTDAQISKYYSVFLNSMATIARNFGAKIIKNAGDCLIFYFPQTSDSIANNILAFKDVIECCLTMIAAHRAINAKLSAEQLPPLNYRISADYGRVEVARSATSQSDDLFGSTMNICAMINSKATPNGIVIGNNMYRETTIFENDYLFQVAGEYSGSKNGYPIYSVESKQKRNILNPFKRTSSSLS